MNQQEIFQNMTKGEWFASFGSIYSDVMRERMLMMRSGMVGHEESVANGELILMMKRETVDKGINPESVEKMKRALEALLMVVENSDELMKYYANTINASKEALTAASLK